jgi:hypothetical protein
MLRIVQEEGDLLIRTFRTFKELAQNGARREPVPNPFGAPHPLRF